MAHISGISRRQVMMMSLEELVSQESLARIIDAFVDGIKPQELGFAHVTTAKEGRPPYHPSDLLKVVLFGAYKGMFSSYQQSDGCRNNLEVILICINPYNNNEYGV